METFLKKFERMIVFFLLTLMMFTVLFLTIELVVILVQELLQPPLFLLKMQNMLDVFGFFLMVLIGLELLESIKAYLDEDRIHAEIVLLVAIVAVSRKVIILDSNDITPELLYGISAIIIALSAGYYLVRHSLHTHRTARKFREKPK